MCQAMIRVHLATKPNRAKGRSLLRNIARFCVGDAGGEFHELDVAEVDFGAFGFEAEVALLFGGLGEAVDEGAVDG